MKINQNTKFEFYSKETKKLTQAIKCYHTFLYIQAKIYMSVIEPCRNIILTKQDMSTSEYLLSRNKICDVQQAKLTTTESYWIISNFGPAEKYNSISQSTTEVISQNLCSKLVVVCWEHIPHPLASQLCSITGVWVINQYCVKGLELAYSLQNSNGLNWINNLSLRKPSLSCKYKLKLYYEVNGAHSAQKSCFISRTFS